MGHFIVASALSPDIDTLDRVSEWCVPVSDGNEPVTNVRHTQVARGGADRAQRLVRGEK